MTRFLPGAYVDDGLCLYEIEKLLECQNYGLGRPVPRILFMRNVSTDVLLRIDLFKAEDVCHLVREAQTGEV